MSIKVLLAEDEPEIREFIEKGLKKVGISVESFDNIDDIRTTLLTQSYDVLVLDRMLKARDALENLTELRKIGTPLQKILILSGRSNVKDRIEGIDLGADEYLPKPFNMEELVARIRMLVRRAKRNEKSERDSIIEALDLRIDLESKQCSRGGKPIDLTAKEFKIIYLLSSHPGKVFSKAELLDRIWENQDIESNAVEVAMARLRSKINIEGLDGIIHCTRGIGYWLGKAKS